MDPKEIGRIVREKREERGLSQAKFAQLIGIKQQSIDAIEKGETRKSKHLIDIANELQISPGSLGLSIAKLPAQGIEPVTSIYGPRDFPIYTAAEGGPGEILRSPDPIDWWPKPVEVQHVKGAYGMYIVGESMIPEFEPGHVAIVHPNLPHIGGKSYIFYAEDEDGQARATVKRLRRATGDTWFVTQHNPPSGQKNDFTLSRKIWATAHRIVGRQDPS